MNWLIKQTIDLQGRHRQHQTMDDVLLIQNNNEAHVWKVEVLDGGYPADLSGYTCKGQFCRANGSTIEVRGSISGNVASVTFSSSCYAIPGTLRAIVTLTKNSKPVSICETYFLVRESVTGTINVVPIDDVVYIPTREIQYLGRRFLDVSDTTATPNDVRPGKWFYTSEGTRTQGSGDISVNVSGTATAVLRENQDYGIVYS